jgi:plasmid stabilization system protein ParE
MILQITFRRPARAELIEAAAWYEAQRPNLGAEFIEEIERCVALAAEHPELYVVVSSVRFICR